jgi:PAS domain S-box-containing protein
LTKKLTESIDAIVWSFDLINDKWLYVSPQIERILGYQPSDWKNLQSWIDIMHPDDQKWAPNFCYSQTQMGLPHNFEYRLMHKNGKAIWIYDKVGVEVINNKPSVLYGVMFDISKQKEVEFTIRERELRLKSIIRILQFETDTISNLLDFTMEEAILLTQSKLGYIYFYDELTAKFTLYSWSKEVMKECLVVDKQTIYALENTGLWGEAVRQRKPIIVNDFPAPNHLKKGYPEGHVQLTRFLTIPVFSDKEIVAVIGVGNKEAEYDESDILDLTLLMESTWRMVQKKQFEELLKIQNEKLAKLNADKDRLMTILSHDLKNPFNAILGYLNLLSKNLLTYDINKVETQINIIYQSASRFYEMLEHLLTWIRNQSGKILFNPQPLLISDLCNEVILDLKLNADSKHIQIQPNLPDSVQLVADKEMLKTIVRNLLANAIKYTNTDGLITLSCEELEESVQIAISDNGMGIEPEKLKHLFEFNKIRSTAGTNDEMGTGLGLIICSEFVAKHKGEIWAESYPGMGTTIKFTLPKLMNQ